MLTFDQAIELLEITDVSKLKTESIPLLEKKIKKRWHPDRVSHLQNPIITEEYTQKFQQIEVACQIITSYLNGTFHAGEVFSQPHQYTNDKPEEIIRENASDIQETLRKVWSIVKEKQYKHTVKEVLLSDGFKLKQLLTEDFKEDLAILSIVSLFYGVIILGILTGIAGAIHPIAGTIGSIFLFIHVLSCVLGFLPLSRFWLPMWLNNVMIKFINFGLGIYNWAERQVENSVNVWVVILIRVPVLFAKLVKYVVLFPLTEVAKMLVADKIVGVVKQMVNYYADAAEWYIEELINKIPDEMTDEELFHLSYLYTELADVGSS